MRELNWKKNESEWGWDKKEGEKEWKNDRKKVGKNMGRYKENARTWEILNEKQNKKERQIEGMEK